MPMLRVSNIVV